MAFNRAFSVSRRGGKAGDSLAAPQLPCRPSAHLSRALHSHCLQEVGHDCTNWTPAVFYDLMRLGDGTGVALPTERALNEQAMAALSPRLTFCALPPLCCSPTAAHPLPTALRCAAGEGVIAAYYGIRGWPMMLPSSERGVFLKKLHGIKVGEWELEVVEGRGCSARARRRRRRPSLRPRGCSVPPGCCRRRAPRFCAPFRPHPQVRILREMTAKGEVPLRPGVDAFLDDALADGASVAVVAGTASVADDGFVSSAMLNLGPNRWVGWVGRGGLGWAGWGGWAGVGWAGLDGVGGPGWAGLGWMGWVGRGGWAGWAGGGADGGWVSRAAGGWVQLSEGWPSSAAPSAPGRLQPGCPLANPSALSRSPPCRAFKLRVVTMGGGSTDGGQQEEAAPSSAPDDDNPFANFEAQASAQRPRRDGVPLRCALRRRRQRCTLRAEKPARLPAHRRARLARPTPQQVQAVQARAKSQAAKEFVRMYNLQKASGMGLEVDPKVRSTRLLLPMRKGLQRVLCVPG